MERITMSLESGLAGQFDEFINSHGYTNRSEAMRDLIRERLESERLKKWEDGHCVATLSYVYNHHEWELSSRITRAHHHSHELNIANTHIHLDHDNCLEIAVMRGSVKAVREFASTIMAERGVRHGKLGMIPVDITEEGHNGHAVPHLHSHPMT